MQTFRAILLIILSAPFFTNPIFGLTIVAKSFSENRLLAEITRCMAISEGIPLKMEAHSMTGIARQRLLLKEIGMYWEYTGTGYTQFLDGKDEELTKAPKALYEYVKREDRKNDIIWLEPIYGINNTK